MRTGMSPLRKLMQISQDRRLHRRRCFSVTSRIDALRTTKETTDDKGFIGEAFQGHFLMLCREGANDILFCEIYRNCRRDAKGLQKSSNT